MSKWESATNGYAKMPTWPLLMACRHEGFGFGLSYGSAKSLVNGEPEQKRELAIVLPIPVIILVAFIFPVKTGFKRLRRKQTGFPVIMNKTPC